MSSNTSYTPLGVCTVLLSVGPHGALYMRVTARNHV